MANCNMTSFYFCKHLKNESKTGKFPRSFDQLLLARATYGILKTFDAPKPRT